MHQDQNLYCGRSALHNVSGFIDEFREKSLHGLVSLLGAKLSLHLMHNINWSNWPAALVTIERGDKESPEGRNSETVNWLQLPPPSSYCRMQHSVLLLLLLCTQDTLAQQQYTWMQMLTVNICCSVGAPGFFWRNTFWVALLVTEWAVFGIF